VLGILTFPASVIAGVLWKDRIMERLRFRRAFLLGATMALLAAILMAFTLRVPQTKA